MKKLNSNNLSQKQINKIKYKAAFSQFVQSLKKTEEYWLCCNLTFLCLKELHKHVSCCHVNDVTNISKTLSKQANDKTLEADKHLPKFVPPTIDKRCCSCSKAFVVILFYHYANISYRLSSLKQWQEKLCHTLNFKGKVRLSVEGINGTLEGCQCAIDAYITILTKSGTFQNLKREDFKSSPGTGQSFDDLVVSICDELCTMGIPPSQLAYTEGGKFLTPEQFHVVLQTMKKMNQGKTIGVESKDIPLLLDCRNFYESKIGHFCDAVTPDLRKFSYFPEYVDRNKDLFEGREILTYCTGGIRCERATAYIKNATKCADVYQLKGGIHKYIEKYPNGFFKGRLFVFDNRYSIGPEASEITSRCGYCSNPWNEYCLCAGRNCRQLVLICQNCAKAGRSFCCEVCKTNHEEDKTTEQCTCTSLRDRIPSEKLSS